jgi:hypothetical protein
MSKIAIAPPMTTHSRPQQSAYASRLGQLSTDAVQRNRGTPMRRSGAAEDLGQTIRLATPVSFSIVTNTMALVLLDQHNHRDR